MKQMNLIYETETESDREQTLVAKVEEGAADWEIGIYIYALPFVK